MMYYRDEGPDLTWLLAFVVLMMIGAVVLGTDEQEQRVARGKVDRENVLVVYPEQLRQ
jgi:hypothetical protein